MKDYLRDIVSHTFDLGGIKLVKVTGTDKETIINAVVDDRSVIIEGRFINPSKDFEGTFGMPNLNGLKILLGLQEYKEGSKVTLTRKDNDEPTGISFENATGDFKNNYRFMSQEVVEKSLPVPRFKGVTWQAEFEPSMVAIQRLKMQSEFSTDDFQTKTENGNLCFHFGDHSTNNGSFVFQDNVGTGLTKAWSYPIKRVISILSLTGDKTFKFSNEGAAMITVNTGLAVYDYILPAQTT